MEFKSLRNIESSFRQIRLFGIVFLSLCAVVTVWSVWNSYRFAEKQREKIYVLDNGKSLMLALSQDLSQNRPAEAREHVRRFHEMFFTLSPEKSAIEHNVKRALLLADKSVYHYYSDFAEKGYYNRIIAGNINQVLKVDSVVCDFTNGNAWRQVSKGIWTACRRKHAAASCWGCSPPSRCLPFTPSAEPSMTSAGTTAHIWKRDTPDGWNCRPRRKQAIT